MFTILLRIPSLSLSHSHQYNPHIHFPPDKVIRQDKKKAENRNDITQAAIGNNQNKNPTQAPPLAEARDQEEEKTKKPDITYGINTYSNP